MRPMISARPNNARRRSPHTELHWTPSAGQGPPGAGSLQREHAPVSRDLGGQDWAEIDPMRVRTSKGIRHRATPAMYFWERTRSHIWCESQEERWEVLWLDYGGLVDRLWSQPAEILFGHGSRLSGSRHIPDFLAQFADGTYGLLNVRPADLVDEAAQLQFDETKKVCEALGWRYRTLTGHSRLATRNLDCLSASRHERCAPSPADESLILNAAKGGSTRGDLCRIAAPDCPPRACAWIDNLAWRRLLRLDLDDVFSSDTLFTSAVQSVVGGRSDG